MKRRWVACLAILALAGTATADSDSKRSNEAVAHRALSDVPEESSRAIAELRSMGPHGLRAFLEANRKAIEDAAVSRNLSNERVLTVLDSICEQKDCDASRLYWYTDISQAQAASSATGKPILSLRLLGRLDQDLSCANSRLFRITLYANEQVSRFLSDRFILHWQSVRPVPKVTIDFGDGRTMERTLTGNSVHYILGPDGQIIDALPGLYGPRAFLRELMRAESVFRSVKSANTPERRGQILRDYHAKRLVELESEWGADSKRAGLVTSPSRQTAENTGSTSTPPTAVAAAAVAFTKAVIFERPVLRGLFDRTRALEAIGNDSGWSAIARLHQEDARLDDMTRKLISFKDPLLTGALLERTVAALEGSIAVDTVRNEYMLHIRIHQWLAGPFANSDLASLNEKVYSELFLTPSWDAWLGLRPDATYSGIDDDGIRK